MSVAGLCSELTLGGFNHGEAQPLKAENNDENLLHLVKTHIVTHLTPLLGHCQAAGGLTKAVYLSTVWCWLIMSKKRSEQQSGQAGSPTEVSIEVASNEMAQHVLKNAALYLSGERGNFSAYFGLSDVVHKRASAKFEGLLRGLGYGEPVLLMKREDKQEALYGANYHLQVTLSSVAERAGRQIIAETTSLMISDEEVMEPAHIRYMGGTEQVLGATGADQA